MYVVGVGVVCYDGIYVVGVVVDVVVVVVVGVFVFVRA